MSEDNLSEINSHGYVMEVPYTQSFFRYQSPTVISLSAQLNGFDAPDPTKPFVYCDLGCGNAITLLCLATAYPYSQFYGIDFNPEHIEFASKLASEAGLKNLTFYSAGFDEIHGLDLPKCDYVTAHGVVSWVVPEIRGQLEDAIEHLIKPSGCVYISYIALPGNAIFSPVWKMMRSYYTQAEGTALERVEQAIKDVTEIAELKASYFELSEQLKKYFSEIQRMDRRYVLHEYCNESHEPFYFGDMEKNLNRIGLTYVGSAKLAKNRAENLIAPDMLPHIERAPNRIEREKRVNFVFADTFRTDVFQSRPAGAAPYQTTRFPDHLRFAQTPPDSKLADIVEVGQRRVDLRQPRLKAVRKLVAQGALTFGELLKHPDLAEYDRSQIDDAVADLLGSRIIQQVLKPYASSEFNEDERFVFKHKINEILAEAYLEKERRTYVVSEITGVAHRLSAVNGIYTRAVHGNRVQDIRPIAEARMQNILETSKIKLFKKKEFASEAWRDAQYETYMRDIFPRLLVLGIFKRA